MYECLHMHDLYNTPMPDHNIHVIVDKVAATIIFLTTELEEKMKVHCRNIGKPSYMNGLAFKNDRI